MEKATRVFATLTAKLERRRQRKGGGATAAAAAEPEEVKEEPKVVELETVLGGGGTEGPEGPEGGAPEPTAAKLAPVDPETIGEYQAAAAAAGSGGVFGGRGAFGGRGMPVRA